METIDEMRKRHAREIEELQKSCKHESISKWMEEWWAIGHSTGFEVKQCNICGKTVKRRTACSKCGKLVEDYKEGDGLHNKPLGRYWCTTCYKEISQ